MSTSMLSLLVLGIFCGASQASVDVQAEQFEAPESTRFNFRSEAEGDQAVWLQSEDRLTLPLCLPEDDEVTVEEVRFSRDGDVQEAVVFVDGNEVGAFNTTGETKFGIFWNVFNTTETTFETVPLDKGQHIIEVFLRNATDPWGIEIDRVTLSFASNATLEEVAC